MDALNLNKYNSSRPMKSARNLSGNNTPKLIPGSNNKATRTHQRRISSRYSQSITDEDEEIAFDNDNLLNNSHILLHQPCDEIPAPMDNDVDDSVIMDESMQIIAEADCLDETEHPC